MKRKYERKDRRTLRTNVRQVHSHLLDPLDRMLRVLHLLHTVIRCTVVPTHRLFGKDFLRGREGGGWKRRFGEEVDGGVDAIVGGDGGEEEEGYDGEESKGRTLAK
jgi:hypothetical protein